MQSFVRQWCSVKFYFKQFINQIGYKTNQYFIASIYGIGQSITNMSEQDNLKIKSCNDYSTL